LERENVIGIIEITISRIAVLSIPKMRLWKSSFKDYQLKSGMEIWILALRTSGRSPQKKRLRSFTTKGEDRPTVRVDDTYEERVKQQTQH